MDHFNYKDGELYVEDVPMAAIAEQYGTPCYVYSRATLERHFHAFDRALGNSPHLICYAVKANSNLAVLNVLAKLGAGFDIVSGGELERVLAAGGDPKKIVFSGVAKQVDEMIKALKVGIYCFNVESAAELELLNHVAEREQCVAPISLRVNPDVDAGSHPYISTGLKENKFGIDIDEALALYTKAQAMPHVKILGVDCHIGSQLTEMDPFLDALDRLVELIASLQAQGITIEHLDLGGGLGVPYHSEKPPQPAEYAQAVFDRLVDKEFKIILEPGRAIAGNAGVFMTQVLFIKETQHKNFAIVDGAMNDLIRPALYSAWQNIIPVKPRLEGSEKFYDIVGPVCETGDFLGKERSLRIKPNDLLVVRTAGAYGFVMSSNYNSRPRVAEVMVDGSRSYLVRRRETVAELFASESILPSIK